MLGDALSVTARFSPICWPGFPLLLVSTYPVIWWPHRDPPSLCSKKTPRIMRKIDEIRKPGENTGTTSAPEKEKITGSNRGSEMRRYERISKRTRGQAAEIKRGWFCQNEPNFSRCAMEAAGVEFIDENGGGAGSGYASPAAALFRKSSFKKLALRSRRRRPTSPLIASFAAADLVALRVDAVAPSGYAADRASVRQKKTGRPVEFEFAAVDD